MRFNKWFVPVLFTLVLMLVVWFASSDQSPAHLNGSTAQSTEWAAGWQAEEAGGYLRPFTMPYRLASGCNIIVSTLPSAISGAESLYVKSNYQQVSAEVGGEPVPVSGIASATGNAVTYDLPWSKLEISPDMAGKSIRLTFSGTGSKPFVEVYSIRLGSNADIRLALLGGSQPSVVISLFILLVALALIVLVALESRRNRKPVPRGYFYLLAFVILSGIWFYTDTDLSGIYFIGNQTFYYVTVFSFLLMPIPYILFIGLMLPRVRRASLALCALLGLNAAAELAMILTGILPPWSGILSANVISVIACVVILLLVNGKNRRQRAHGELSVGIAFTSVGGVISLALFYLTPLANNSVAFRVAVIMLIMSLSVSVLRAAADIAAQADRMEQLRIREEEYRIAVHQSEKYVLRFDMAQRKLLRGGDPSPLYNADQDLPDMPDSFIAAGNVAEESVPDIHIFFGEMAAGKPSGSCAASLRNRDGSYAWYRIDYTMIYSDQGEPLQAVLSFCDISEQHRKELAYQKWKQRYADMPQDGMSLYEYNLTRNIPVGEAGRMLPPLPEDVRPSLPLVVDYLAEQIVYPDDSQRFRAFLERDRLLEIFARGIRSDELEFRRIDADLQARWTVASIQLIADPYSGDVQTSLLLQDEDEAKRNELQVRDRSNSDPLTGLLNRTAFEEQLTLLLEQTDPGAIHALLMIDLDGFKLVNDTYGHQFGDRVLTDIANSLRAVIRNEDLIGRVGGDEFMVCLRNIRDDKDFVEKRASFLCRALNITLGSDVVISGSVGIAMYPEDGIAFGTLYQKADKALYYAKHHGKNRFVFYRGTLGDGADAASAAPGPRSELTAPDDVNPSLSEGRRTLQVADESEATQNGLREIFGNDFRLLTARSGAECMAILENRSSAVSAMLLDLSIDGGKGLDILGHMQKNAAFSSIPVIVTSDTAESEFGLAAVELGATDVITRPFDSRLLKLRVQNVIRKRETEELRAQNRYLLMQKSDEARHQNELRYIAEHDPLTNICNKAAFYRKTKLMLDKSPGTVFVMIAFDIEKFRLVNDIFGHEEGDRLLRHLAQRMQTLFSEKGTYSRIDADNFTLCLPYEPQELRARMMECDRNLKEYDLPFEILLVYGLYIIDDRTLPVSIMHDRADMAKRTVKGNYVRRYAYYDDKLRKELLEELDIVNDMNGALQKKQFEIYLQPKCKLSTGEIIGAEALVRWNHPTRGVLLPGAFVPIFERNGFIMKMDVYVWEQVYALIRGWMDRHGGQPPLPVSMNISRVDIYNPALVNTLCALSDRYGVPRRYIELEITESAYAEDPKLLSELIATLRSKGFTVEMDDFGSAYSSLNMLKEIQVDLLKLDMRFLYGSDTEGRGGTILSSVVRMARYLQLPIVAEGVETVEQARFLVSIGCTLGQGFLFYKPMPVAEFERLLADKPHQALKSVGNIYPESAVRRVWSIDGDFGTMLSTIPCAASLCELNGKNLELLRINQEYLAVTGDSAERVYQSVTNVVKLTTDEEYKHLLQLFGQAFETQGTAEGSYNRLCEDGSMRAFHVKIKFLTGDTVRSLFFVTYQPAGEATAPETPTAPTVSPEPATPAVSAGSALPAEKREKGMAPASDIPRPVPKRNRDGHA